ncbi:E3 binding domain-containing protein, partial [Buchnera aphidicola]|nr:E3 binding domain-containing protein [Buchnera aphidicola]
NFIKKIKRNDRVLFHNASSVHATPWIRRLARNLNINLNDVNPSGRKNRILKEDLELYQRKNHPESYKNHDI